jgi:putative ABC transport system ATP-binding protein
VQSPILTTSGLCRFYRRGPQQIKAVENVSIEIGRGQFFGIVGSSGSGKSTLLYLLAGLDHPTSGSINFNGTDLASLSRPKLAQYRAKSVGMIFQTFNLLPHRTALENVEMALYFSGTPGKERRQKARMALEELNLGDRLDHKPNALSGGEQQRVAVARALVKQPDIIFADEPTGNLDKTNAHQIAEILKELNSKGITVVLVTHDENFTSKYARRIIRMEFGSVVEEVGKS